MYQTMLRGRRHAHVAPPQDLPTAGDALAEGARREVESVLGHHLPHRVGQGGSVRDRPSPRNGTQRHAAGTRRGRVMNGCEVTRMALCAWVNTYQQVGVA